VKRRYFLAAGCAGCAALIAGRLSAADTWQAPMRLQRPALATDEGGLWSLMDREETRLRRSPFALRDAGLQEYVRDIACRLGGDHCADIRVHLVHTPLFNASMAPNGMMQVWTGLLLRAENEAQLAAILGHEIGHYMARHSLEQLRDVKSRSAFAQFLGLFGAVGALGQLGLLAGSFAYSRDHEREADRIGLLLMRRAGYDPAQAPRIWENLLLESKARRRQLPDNPLFATHPAPEDRRDALASLAAETPGGESREQIWRAKTRPFVREWLNDEVKRGQHEESLALFNRMLQSASQDAEVIFARAETFRLRGGSGDLDAALADYQGAIRAGSEPPAAHRGLGLLYRQRQQPREARASLQRYLELAADAPDAPMIRSYVEELAI
jgi:predicted Zn-dependent protease